MKYSREDQIIFLVRRIDRKLAELMVDSLVTDQIDPIYNYLKAQQLDIHCREVVEEFIKLTKPKRI